MAELLIADHRQLRLVSRAIRGGGHFAIVAAPAALHGTVTTHVAEQLALTEVERRSLSDERDVAGVVEVLSNAASTTLVVVSVVDDAARSALNALNVHRDKLVASRAPCVVITSEDRGLRALSEQCPDLFSMATTTALVDGVPAFAPIERRPIETLTTSSPDWNERAFAAYNAYVHGYSIESNSESIRLVRQAPEDCDVRWLSLLYLGLIVRNAGALRYRWAQRHIRAGASRSADFTQEELTSILGDRHDSEGIPSWMAVHAAQSSSADTRRSWFLRWAYEHRGRLGQANALAANTPGIEDSHSALASLLSEDKDQTRDAGARLSTRYSIATLFAFVGERRTALAAFRSLPVEERGSEYASTLLAIGEVDAFREAMDTAHLVARLGQFNATRVHQRDALDSLRAHRAGWLGRERVLRAIRELRAQSERLRAAIDTRPSDDYADHYALVEAHRALAEIHGADRALDEAEAHLHDALAILRPIAKALSTRRTANPLDPEPLPPDGLVASTIRALIAVRLARGVLGGVDALIDEALVHARYDENLREEVTLLALAEHYAHLCGQRPVQHSRWQRALEESGSRELEADTCRWLGRALGDEALVQRALELYRALSTPAKAIDCLEVLGERARARRENERHEFALREACAQRGEALVPLVYWLL